MAPPRCLAIVPILAAGVLGCTESEPEPFPAPRYVSCFGAWGTDDGEFENPWAIAVGPDSLLYVGDTGNTRIDVFTPDGEFVRHWPLGAPNSFIVIGPDSTVYAHLYTRQELVRYTRNGDFLESWDFVNAVGGLEVDASGNRYVYGRRIYGPDPFHLFVEGPYIWKFNSQWELLKKWGYPGPQDTTGWVGGRMTWNTNGNLLVLGELDSTTAVFEFTPDGDPISAVRLPSLELGLLEDIACDRSNRIFITRPLRDGRVYMFDSRGRLLTEWTELDEHHEPLSQPAGIAIDMSGFLQVVDYRRYRVVKFELSP